MKAAAIFLLVFLFGCLKPAGYETTMREGGSEYFTVVVLPDTQKYSKKYPDIFLNQTRWIKTQIKERNIVYVIHLGDLVDDADSETQWNNANKSMSLLDDAVAYGISPGNHDTPTTYYNKFFPAQRYESQSWFGGSYCGYDNSYNYFIGQDIKYIVLHLNVCPGREELVWADEVLSRHKGFPAIISTHGYLNKNGERRVHVCGSTEEIWEKVIKPNDNVFLVLSGHAHAEAYRLDEVGGRAVHQILSDYQSRNRGGEGFLRIMTFNESGIHIKTYSPYLDEYERDSDSEYTIEWKPPASD
ncbi:MAG: hypothetical protein GF334_05305 [Candidatus Altiarchaeales archaeon]|nr:hypothetical protein [Candidatus Altiarchaeales archaeon]